MKRSAFALTLIVVTVVAGCSKSAQSHLDKANEYITSSRGPEAIIELRSALQIEPDRGDIRLILAEQLMKAKDIAGARKEFVRAADLRPTDINAQLQAGRILLATGATEDAKTRAAKALALDAKNVDAQLLKGNILAGLKDLDGAISEYQEAIALDPSRDTAYANIAVVQAAQGHKEEAEATFRKAIQVAPKSIPARMGLVNLLWALGRTADAEAMLKEALAIDPTDLSVNRALGVFYLASNRAAEAEPYFQTIARKVNTPAATVSLADYYIGTRRVDQARKVLTDLSKTPEGFGLAMTRLAAIDASEGYRPQALDKIHQILEKNPKDMSARLLQARVLYADNKRDDALTAATAIVTEQPNSAAAGDAEIVRGSILASTGHTQAAISAYQNALKKRRQPVTADLALGALHLTMGEVDKAATYINEALTAQPGYPLARALKVRVLLVQKRMDEAKALLASLQKDFPKSAVVLDLLAAEQLTKNQVDAARALYRAAADLQPNDIEALTGLTQIDMATGHTKEAVARIDDALKRMPPSPQLYFLSGRVYAVAGNTARAEEVLTKAVTLDPSHLDTYVTLGQFYISQRRLDDAKVQFKKLIDHDSSSVGANTMLAMILEVQKNLPDAEAQYKKVLAINPKAPVAANNLAMLYINGKRNLNEALALAQAAVRQAPDEPHFNDTLGWTYFLLDQPSMAMPYLESSAKHGPNDPVTQYHLGRAYVEMGQNDKAKQALKRAFTLAKDFEGSAEARKALTELGG